METLVKQPVALAAAEQTALAKLAAELRGRASTANHRLALAFAGSRDWTISASSAALCANPCEQVVWLSEQRLGDRVLPIRQGHKLLGSEVDALVYNAHDGFDPDSFGAALGALRGGGLLVLLLPGLESWPRLPDPQAARVAVHPFSAHQVSGRFLSRFARVLAESDAVSLVPESAPIPPPRVPRAEPPSPLSFVSSAGPPNHCRTLDQARAVDAILTTAYGRARRPLVLTSDRGRGKSSALGIASARLLEGERRHILVTAPRRSALDPLFHHATRLLPEAEIHRNRISHRLALLEFLPPDKLCRTARSADLLLVDEAAAIPGPLLEQLLIQYPRVIFATTVNGYEGTGRGFEIRFRLTLDRLTPNWHELCLETPIRWAPADPLEQFAAKALLLNATPAAESQVRDANPVTCRFQQLDRDALANDEATLSQLFGLLVLAHYQTRPMDLRHLLDGPNLRIYVLLHQEQVAATALVAAEGGFEAGLARDIFEGRRRPRGHLLPQTLSAHAGINEATALAYARVIRIAVHPGARRRGLGRMLLAGVIDQTRAQGLDLVGSSFGASEGLLDFWEHCGFVPVHLGTNRNAASGAHAAVLLHPLSPAGKSLESLASARLGKRLPMLLAEALRDLEPEIAACLLRNTPGSDWSPSTEERRELESFTSALRTYEAALPPLLELVATCIGESLRAERLDNSERNLLIYKVLQHRDWGETARLLGVAGRAQTLSLLRTATGKLMEPFTSK